MPVEIRELIISATIVDDSVARAGEHGDDTPEGEESEATSTHEEWDRDALIQACVEQTLKILKRSRER